MSLAPRSPFAADRHATGIARLWGGRLVMDLMDLNLELEPLSPAAGESVTAWTRGGPAGALAGLCVVSVDDVAVREFGAFGVLDTFGEWTLADTVPPGLSGTTMALQAWSVGFDQHLARSAETLLQFE
ncbi:MAG: hypothetical protein FJ293_09210 [Planctomycetes bacterium]|nr:hypothetical protein [Planctomycetota bacterium]